jgi:hypothetical protein
MPAVPPTVSGGPSAPWPGPLPPPPPPRPLNMLVQTLPQGPGILPTPGAPPLRSFRRGRAAAAGVGTLCASAGCWGSPADALCGPRLSAPASPLAFRPRPPRRLPGDRGSRPLPCPDLVGFIIDRPGALPRLPLSSVADGPPTSVMGGERGLPCSFRPSGGCRVRGHLGCSVRMACQVVRVVFDCSPGLLPGAAKPYLPTAAFPLTRALGRVYPCVFMLVSYAHMSARGLTSVSGCIDR